jgi:hypothetical protein
MRRSQHPVVPPLRESRFRRGGGTSATSLPTKSTRSSWIAPVPSAQGWRKVRGTVSSPGSAPSRPSATAGRRTYRASNLSPCGRLPERACRRAGRTRGAGKLMVLRAEVRRPATLSVLASLERSARGPPAGAETAARA